MPGSSQERKGGFYHHFASKQDVFEACADRLAEGRDRGDYSFEGEPHIIAVATLECSAPCRSDTPTTPLRWSEFRPRSYSIWSNGFSALPPHPKGLHDDRRGRDRWSLLHP